MSPRRAVLTIVTALATLLGHLLLVRAMAHGHVAHVLLGAGNATPPLGAALLAVALVLVRLAAVVLVPGLLLASVVSLLAHWLGTGTTSGAGSSELAGSGGATGTGASIDGRGTK